MLNFIILRGKNKYGTLAERGLFTHDVEQYI